MNQDFEKSRVEYVTRIELINQTLQREVADLKLIEKWEPRVATVLDPGNNEGRLTLSFGGHNMTVQLPYSSLAEVDTATLVNAVLDSVFANLVRDRLRTVIEPQVKSMQQGVQATAGAGKW